MTGLLQAGPRRPPTNWWPLLSHKIHMLHDRYLHKVTNCAFETARDYITQISLELKSPLSLTHSAGINWVQHLWKVEIPFINPKRILTFADRLSQRGERNVSPGRPFMNLYTLRLHFAKVKWWRQCGNRAWAFRAAQPLNASNSSRLILPLRNQSHQEERKSAANLIHALHKGIKN